MLTKLHFPPFPKYPLNVVEKDIREKIGKSNKNLLSKLPKLPNEVGGIVDIMIGKHYLKYFLIEVARLESGLTLYNSMFESADGTTGVVSGPHREFTKPDRSVHFASDMKLSYYSPSVINYFDYLSLQLRCPSSGEQRIPC